MDRKQMNERFGVSDEQLDEWAKEYEDGTWEAPLGKVILGRPSIADEEVRPVTVRLPLSKIIALDSIAAQNETTRSKTIRDAVDQYLLQV